MVTAAEQLEQEVYGDIGIIPEITEGSPGAAATRVLGLMTSAAASWLLPRDIDACLRYLQSETASVPAADEFRRYWESVAREDRSLEVHGYYFPSTPEPHKPAG